MIYRNFRCNSHK